jgi:lipopolysaccharide/colanic/teichoic acid biosynthesis glycosyltransferase
MHRTLDIALSAAMLVAAAPVLGAAAVAIKVEDGGPVLYRQLRVGKDGADFELLKLRTMVVDAETMGAGLAVDHGDPRITRVGRVLRRLSLDELPQLWNVLRGDMSLVGPRPERPYFAAQFGREILRYSDRTRMQAGMTGWAQVHGLNGDTSIVERAQFDNQYIEYWSPWLDVVILARTLAASITHRSEGEQ